MRSANFLTECPKNRAGIQIHTHLTPLIDRLYFIPCSNTDDITHETVEQELMSPTVLEVEVLGCKCSTGLFSLEWPPVPPKASSTKRGLAEAQPQQKSTCGLAEAQCAYLSIIHSLPLSPKIQDPPSNWSVGKCGRG
jgi:hypothetical protein